jgi:hypothetical protein
VAGLATSIKTRAGISLNFTSDILLLTNKKMEEERWRKWVPVAAFMVSCISFLFALTVLYPWHIELSKEFSTLSKKISQCK